MDLNLTTVEGVLVAHASGVIDDTSRDPFREQLHPHLAVRGGKLIVDLSQATRITSPGLAQLVTLAAHANTTSSHVVFCAPTPYVRTVLSATRLDSYLTVEPTLEEALSRLANIV